jgi:tetratricopeptide (TPR) repeat protein
VLVKAPGGFGKSALCAQIVDRVLDGRWPSPAPALACFFIRADGARNTTVAFLQAVNAQLLDHLSLPGGTPPGLTELQGQLSELWSEAVERATADRPLLLLVDGLDEMAPEDVNIADALPGGLADHVHVIVSSRVAPDARELVLREHPLRRAEPVDLEAFGEEGIRELMERYGIAGLDRGPARILALTRGEPLFARFVCEAVGSHGAAELDRLEQHPPADAEDYFREQLNRLDEAELGDLSWQVLGALVVAHGGLTEDELAEALGQPRRALRGALRPVRRFLLGDERLDIFHRRLSELVAGEFSAAELDALRARFVAWCRGYGERGWPPETPRYVLDHCARHYGESDPAALVALPDGAWLTRQRESTGTPAGFIRDVEVALGAADPAQTVRLCLIGGNAVAMAGTVPALAIRVLAQCGAAEEARVRAGLAAGDGRAPALTELGNGLAARGDADGAAAAFAAAAEQLAAVEFKFDDDYVAAFAGLARAAPAAIVTRMLDAAPDMDWPEDRAACLGAAAAALRAAGDATAATAAIRATIVAARDGDGLSDESLAALMVAAGDAGARSLLDELTPTARGVVELAGAAEGWARAGEEARATELAAGIDAAHVRALSDGAGLAGLSAAILRLEHPVLAATRRALGVRLAEGLRRRFPGEAEVRALAAVGDVAGLEAAEARVDAEHNDLLGALAEAYGRVGAGESAVRCLRGMELGDGSLIDAAVPPVATALAAAGRIDAARAAADVAVHAAARAEAIAAAAGALLEAGQAEPALAEARRAIRAAEAVEDQGAAAGAYGAIAAAFHAAGDAGRALECAERARAALERVLPGARVDRDAHPVIDALVLCGRLDEALALADGEYPDLPKIAAVATAFASAGERERALELADRVAAAAFGEWAGVRVTALIAAAEAFRAAGAEDRARESVQAAQRMSEDDAQFVGEELVRGLRELGDPDAAAAAAGSLVGDDAPPDFAARVFGAAGLSAQAAEAAREALAAPDDEYGPPVQRHVGLAVLLAPGEIAPALERLREAAAGIANPFWRAEALATVAAAQHAHDPARAGATLREAFLAAWIGGRDVVMRVIAIGPLGDLAPDLPERLMDWIPEIDGWWL